MTWGGGHPPVSGRKYSPLAADVGLAAGKSDVGEQGQQYLGFCFTTTPGTVVGVGCNIDTGSWSASTAAAPFCAVTATGNNELLFAGVLVETTSAGGPGVYAIQRGGPITLTLAAATASINFGARLVQTNSAASYTTQLGGNQQATATNDVVNRFAVPMIVANQTHAVTTASATIAAVMLPPGLKYEAIQT